MRAALGAITAWSLMAASATAQVVQAGPVALDFTGRAQIQLSTTSIGEEELGAGDGVPSTAFETRRVRFGAEFVFDEWITGALEVDFGGAAASLTDAFITVPLAEAFAVSAGQQKKPFGLFELTSNTKILTIERSARLRGLEAYLGAPPGDAHTLLEDNSYVGRDIGVLVHGQLGRLGYAAGVFNGSGPNTREALGSKAYAGRLTVAVAERLLLGTGLSRQPVGVSAPDGDELIGTAWAVDAELGAFRAPGLHVMAEVMGGDDPVVAIGAELPTMLGAQAAAAWFLPRAGRVEGVEPVLRLSWADPDRDAAGDEGALLTPGVNLYFTGRNRLMLNGDIYIPAGDAFEAQYGLIAQLQVHF